MSSSMPLIASCGLTMDAVLVADGLICLPSVHCARLEANKRHHEAQARVGEEEEEALDKDVLDDDPPSVVVAATTMKKPTRAY